MKRDSYKRYVLYSIRCMAIIGLCLLSPPALFAQRYPFHNLSVDDGLMQSQAMCMAQDKTGTLWIGTLGGLSRYDGRNFTNYTVRNGLLTNVVESIAVDSAGNIWIGSPAGISQFNGKSFVHYRKPQQITRPANTTQQMQIVGDTVWWRAQGELYFVTRGKIKYFVPPGPDGFVTSFLAGQNSLWIAKDSVLYRMENNRCDTIRFRLAEGERAPHINRIFRDRGLVIWLTTNNGLYTIEDGHMVPYVLNGTPLTSLSLRSCMTQDKAGALWIGAGSGVVKLSGNNLQYYNKHNGLSDNIFFDIITDNEGNVWLASDGQGVFRFSGTQFTVLDETMGLPSAQVMAIASNRNDSLFLGSYEGGLFTYKDGKISSLTFPSNPVPSITSLCYTHKGKLWIGTRGRGLWSYDNEIFRQYEAPDRGFPSNAIQSLYEDPQRRMWIGFTNGAMVLEHDTFKTAVSKNTSVVAFVSIGDNKVLMSSDPGGLLLYDNGEVSDFKTNTIVDSSSVQCFAVSGQDLWMGTAENGVIRYNMTTGKALAINKTNGLRSDFIYNIIADNDGNIWVGTGFGIHKIAVNSQDEPSVSFYGKAQGITGMESNINSVLKQPDGTIWFGTTNGAIHYQPHSDVVSSAPTSIVLQSVKLGGETIIDKNYYDSTDNWYGIPYDLRLPYKKNNITFTFQAITLSGAQEVLYRYRMDGLDAPWSDWSPNNSVTYSALPPGKYVFHVQSSGADSDHSPELTYAFEIITPFQKTTWFRFSVLISCILIGILLQYSVNSRKRRREKLLEKLRIEEQGKIRMRTAEDFHDEIGNKLTRINVLTSVLKNKLDLNFETERLLKQIEENTGQLYGGTRDILWSLKPSNDNLYEILYRIRDFGGELFQDTEVNFTFTGTDEKWRNFRLPMDMSRNLIMIFKEALNNCLKYSHAKNVTIEVTLKNRNVLQMILKDDGIGFDMHTARKGNGIANMHTRAGRLNGKLYLDSRPNKGTILNLTFKIPPNR